MKTGKLVKTLAAAALVAAIACTAVTGQAAPMRGAVSASTALQEVSKQEQIYGINTGYIYGTAGTLQWRIGAQGGGLYVNRLTGNVAYHFNVGDLSFVYNSSQDENYGFGNGVTCAQAPRMEKLSDTVFKNVRDDGSTTYYVNGSCDYSGASSAHLNTYPDGSSQLTLGVHQKIVTLFDEKGRANNQARYPFGQMTPVMTYFYYYEESGYLGEIYSQGKADDLHYVQDANGQYRLDNVVSGGQTYTAKRAKTFGPAMWKWLGATAPPRSGRQTQRVLCWTAYSLPTAATRQSWSTTTAALPFCTLMRTVIQLANLAKPHAAVSLSTLQ